MQKTKQKYELVQNTGSWFCLFVRTCLLAGLCKKYQADFPQIYWRGVACAEEELIQFCGRSISHSKK